MINVSLNVDDSCQDCPYFNPSIDHATNHDNVHMLFITCERYVICGYLKDRIRKEVKEVKK